MTNQLDCGQYNYSFTKKHEFYIFVPLTSEIKL
jgi:hypothetical protein